MADADKVREDDPFAVLRRDRERIEALEAELQIKRDVRDARALALVEAGHSWRAVAEAAGFANPYIAQLKWRARRREGASNG